MQALMALWFTAVRRIRQKFWNSAIKFRAEDKETPIVVVPSSFNTITEAELAEHGVNIVIYANQLTRSAFPAMEQTAKDILKYHRAKEVDSRLMPIKQILTLIDEL